MDFAARVRNEVLGEVLHCSEFFRLVGRRVKPRERNSFGETGLRDLRSCGYVGWSFHGPDGV